MLDMGFIHDLKKIIQFCPPVRQTMLFSATISREIQDLAKRFTKNSYFVSVPNQVDPSKLKQVFYDVPKNKKLSLLAQLLKEEKSDLALVFCNTRRNTDFVYEQLKANGISATAIHGGLTQSRRARTLKQFSDKNVEVLICTDVAARGLHIDNVSHVYNYDLPKNPIDYVHRIGRTARAGEEGKVINLLCEIDYANFRSICKKYAKFSIEDIQMPEITKNIRVVMPNKSRQGPERRGGFSGKRQRFPGNSDNRERRSFSKKKQGFKPKKKSERSHKRRRRF